MNLRSPFRRSKCWPIALDLGSDSVKLLQMRRTGPVLRVRACGRWKLPAALQTEPKQRRDAQVGAVREILRAGGFTGRGVISSLGGRELLVKNIRLPHMNPEELQKAILWEAKERFDFEVAPDRIGHINAGQVRQGNETRDEIILLAVRQEDIDEHLSMLADMGLSPEHIDAAPVALFRVFEQHLRRQSDEQAVSAIVDIGRSATWVIVSRGRQIVFMKSIDIGGNRFTEAVARQLNLPQPEAAELRTRILRQHAQSPAPAEAPVPAAPAPGASAPAAAARAAPVRDSVDWTIRDAVRAEVESLAKEIGLCLRYCSVTFRGVRVDQIVLTGGESYDPAVVELLVEHLGLPCVVGQPLKGLDVSGVDMGADRRATLAEWAVCAGLSARHADLISPAREGKDGNHRLSA